MIKLSTSEQRLVDIAQEQFGERLTEFLLTGLGEDALTQRRHLAITYAGDEGPALTRDIEIITHEPSDGPSLLPRHRNPLVLLALLRLLLREGSVAEASLRFDRKDILSLLGWKDTQETRGEIDEALDRYSLLMYRWETNKAELSGSNLSFHKANENLILRYTIISREGEGREPTVLEFIQVIFSPHFVEQLHRRALFGIDWNKVQSVSQGQK